MNQSNTRPEPEFAPFVDECARWGIGRSAAFDLARDGLLDTFTIGRKRFVRIESLRSLPDRLAAQQQTQQSTEQNPGSE